MYLPIANVVDSDRLVRRKPVASQAVMPDPTCPSNSEGVVDQPSLTVPEAQERVSRDDHVADGSGISPSSLPNATHSQPSSPLLVEDDPATDVASPKPPSSKIGYEDDITATSGCPASFMSRYGWQIPASIVLPYLLGMRCCQRDDRQLLNIYANIECKLFWSQLYTMYSSTLLTGNQLMCG